MSASPAARAAARVAFWTCLVVGVLSVAAVLAGVGLTAHQVHTATGSPNRTLDATAILAVVAFLTLVTGDELSARVPGPLPVPTTRRPHR